MGYSPSEYRPSQGQGAPLCDSGMLGIHPTLAFSALMFRPPPGWKVAAVIMGQGVGRMHPHQGAKSRQKTYPGAARKQDHMQTKALSLWNMQASPSHQTSFTKQKFEVKIIKNFWLATTEQ